MRHDVFEQSEPVWEVRDSGIHGKGLYARVDLPAGCKVIEYVGRRIDKAESARLCEKNNPYIFQVNDQYDLDGSVGWNPARFANHSCQPNCEADQGEDDRIWVRTLRPVEAGEELTYNYGYDLEDYRENPCRCGAPNCVGYIVAEEYWDVVRQNTATRAVAQL